MICTILHKQFIYIYLFKFIKLKFHNNEIVLAYTSHINVQQEIMHAEENIFVH